MKIPDELIDKIKKIRPLKCKDCHTSSTAVYLSKKYNCNLCVPCLMKRIRSDINND